MIDPLVPPTGSLGVMDPVAPPPFLYLVMMDPVVPPLVGLPNSNQLHCNGVGGKVMEKVGI